MSERFARALDLFHAACELPPAERGAFLEGACAGDARLLDEVRELLARDPMLADLPGPARRGAGAEPLPLPARIGPYHVLRHLGSGSSGDVYEAEQAAPRRKVALKVLRGGLAGERDLARFAREAEILARLDHPVIARVIETGVHGAGVAARPYLAMEYVEGVAPAEHAAARGLSLAERLLLMATIADGVAHAHSRGVIHRDLKQANVVVDAAGAPHVVDFGVARPAAVPSGVETLRGQLLGTLATMSPEQASGDPARIDVRTDVYALGAIAFELLAGRLPLELGDEPISRSLRRIEEEVPPRLGSLDRRLRGDIEAVVAKALEKDPERRYASAAELAAELRRAARGEPVTAAAPSLWRALAWSARRHRTAVAGAAAVVVALLLTSIGAVSRLLEARAHARRAEHEQAEAELARDAAESIVKFLGRLLQLPAPAAAGPDAKIKDVLRLWEAEVGSGLGGQPRIEARVRDILATTFMHLGLYGQAEANARRSRELYRTVVGANPMLPLRMTHIVVTALMDRGELAAADRELEGYLAEVAAGGEITAPQQMSAALTQVRLRLAQGRSAEAFELLGPLGAVLERDVAANPQNAVTHAGLRAEAERKSGNMPVAIEWQTRAVELGERFELPPRNMLARRGELAELLRAAGRLAEAIAELERCVAESGELEGVDHPYTLGLRLLLLRALADASQVPRALEVSEDLLAALRLPEHADLPLALPALTERGELLMRCGRLEEAEVAFREALERAGRLKDFQGSLLAETELRLGFLYGMQGRFDEAIPLMEGAVARLDDPAAGSTADGAARARTNLAVIYAAAGRFDLAEQAYRQSLEVLEAALGADHPLPLGASVSFSRFLSQHGGAAEARTRLTAAAERAARALGPDHLTSVLALESLAEVEFEAAQAEGDPAAAAAALARIEAALAALEARLPAFSEEVSTAANALVEAYCESGRRADAAELLERRRARAVVELAPDDPRHAELAAELAELGDSD